MILEGRRFRPTWWGTLMMLAAVALTLSLAHWQLRRADARTVEAAAHQAALRAHPVPLPVDLENADAYAYRRVRVRGTFDAARTVFLDHRVREGRVGYEVASPLRLRDSDRHLLVLRGWIARGIGRSEAPQVATPVGEIELTGIALAGIPQWYEPSDARPTGAIWQNLRVEVFASVTGLRMHPVILEQRSDSGDGIDRDWPVRGDGARKNLSYALQWYSLAALSLVLWLILSLRRRETPAD